MARPERNNVDYFPFICEEGTKMFYIEQTYGNDGFATFVKLLRELAKTDFHYLNLSNPKTLMYLSAKCRVKVEVLESIITDLADLGKFHKVLWTENRVIWCQDFIDSITDAYFKRKNKCIDFDSLLHHLDSLGVRKLNKLLLSGTDNPQSKVEYRKEEESRVNLKAKSNSKNEIFASELLNSPQWIETICMQNKITPAEVEIWMEKFKIKLISEVDEKINKQDFGSHFSRWVSAEVKNPKTMSPGQKTSFHENRA